MRRAIVLGGSGYVGSAIARALARDGARLALSYHANREKGEALARELNGQAFHCDLSNPCAAADAVTGAASWLGGADALVIAAGRGEFTPFFETKLSDVSAALRIAVEGAFASCRAAAEAMRASQGGEILLVSSIDAVKTLPSPPHLAASQAALRGLVGSLAKELGKHSIRVNLLACGLLAGGVTAKVDPKLRETYLEHCSLKRLGRAEEVAEVASWLIAENTYLTGQAVVLDGGL